MSGQQVDTAGLLAGSGENSGAPWSKGFHGLIECSGLTSWRSPNSNRTPWKAACSCIFCTAMLYYLYIVGPYSPIGSYSFGLCICGAVCMIKAMIEVWGQDTPTWICPGTWYLMLVVPPGFVFCIVYLLGYCTQVKDIDFPGRVLLGVVMYLFGSFYSLGYEMHRFQWKAQPENKGRLHTIGLAAYCIHPNYFGDLFTYSGWALVGGTWCAMSLVFGMIWLFSLFVIPNSDAYLANRYPEEFPAYSAATATLIPGFHNQAALRIISWILIAVSLWASSKCTTACGG